MEIHELRAVLLSLDCTPGCFELMDALCHREEFRSDCSEVWPGHWDPSGFQVNLMYSQG